MGRYTKAAMATFYLEEQCKAMRWMKGAVFRLRLTIVEYKNGNADN